MKFPGSLFGGEGYSLFIIPAPKISCVQNAEG